MNLQVMAKQQNNQPITAADIQEFARSQDDFSFELEVLHLAKGFGLTAVHAGTYQDPATNKPRQFDIRAFKDIGDHRIQLAIECKSISVADPLVLSCVPRPTEDSLHHVIRSTTQFIGMATIHNFEGDNSIYRPRDLVGKSMRQIRREGDRVTGSDSDMFDKWTQAIASCEELLANEVERLGVLGTVVHSAFVMPVLVVPDNCLWTINYSPNGAESSEPTQVTEATFFVGRDFQIPAPLAPITYHITHLHIFTRSGIMAFLEDVSKAGQLWLDIFKT
jgi:hypothetical protein